MAVISKGITLSYRESQEDLFTALTNLTEIADIGGDVEAIETTTLADAAHTYTNGLISYGDSLAFKFNYETEQFRTLRQLEGICEWQVSLPDGSACLFSGSSSVKLDGVGVGALITYTLNIKPNSAMDWDAV